MPRENTFNTRLIAILLRNMIYFKRATLYSAGGTAPEGEWGIIHIPSLY